MLSSKKQSRLSHPAFSKKYEDLEYIEEINCEILEFFASRC